MKTRTLELCPPESEVTTDDKLRQGLQRQREAYKIGFNAAPEELAAREAYRAEAIDRANQYLLTVLAEINAQMDS